MECCTSCGYLRAWKCLKTSTQLIYRISSAKIMLWNRLSKKWLIPAPLLSSKPTPRMILTRGNPILAKQRSYLTGNQKYRCERDFLSWSMISAIVSWMKMKAKGTKQGYLSRKIVCIARNSFLFSKLICILFLRHFFCTFRYSSRWIAKRYATSVVSYVWIWFPFWATAL